MQLRIALFLLAVLGVSGCLGGGGGSQSSDVPPPTTSTPAPTVTEEEGPGEEEGFYNPHHTHNLWGDRTEIALFQNFEIELGKEPANETMIRQNALISGFREFTSRSDGEHYKLEDQTDVVFQGTKEILFTITWPEDDPATVIPGLSLFYKPANTPLFTQIKDIRNGQEYVISLGKGWADMAHQEKLSRWKFRVEAFDPDMANQPVQVHLAKGKIHLSMKAINGGHVTIDDPHPYYFLNVTMLHAGEINKTVNAKVVAPLGQTVGDDLKNWNFPTGQFIPWDTHFVHASVHYNYTGPLSDVPHELGLSYTDASGETVKYPTVTEKGAGYAYYKIPIQTIEADDPYAYKSESDWTFGVYPIVAEHRDVGGEFEGNVHIVVLAEGSDEVGTE